MAAPQLYQSHIAGDADNVLGNIAANIPRIDRRPWTVRIRTACKGTDLPLGARAVGMAVASYFDHAGTWAVSRKALCAELDISERTLTRYLQQLKAADVLDVQPGGADGRSCSRYAPGPRIATMAPARRTEPATGGCARAQAGGAPAHTVSFRSGSPRRTKQLASTSGTQPNSRARRADIRSRYTCSACSRSWPVKHGDRCHGCGGRAIEAIDAGLAAAERHDRMQAERLQAEVANRPVTCRRCGNGDARRGDMADTGRCAVCVPLADDEAVALRRKGEPLLRQLRESWKSHDHVRGKATAQELAELYAAATGAQHDR